MIFFKNRKSRKQLLQEIEELKNENEKLKEQTKIIEIRKNIITLTASCITYNDGDDYINVAKEYLCQELGQQIMQYFSYEKHIILNNSPQYEYQHIGKINIVNEN